MVNAYAVFSLGRETRVGRVQGRALEESTHRIEEPSDVIVGDHKYAFSPMAEFVQQGKGVYCLVKASS